MRHIYILPLVLMAFASLGSFIYLMDEDDLSALNSEGAAFPLEPANIPDLSIWDAKTQHLRPAKFIRKRSDFRRLSVGSNFMISGIARGQAVQFAGLVDVVERRATYDQFHISIGDSGKGIATVTDDSVNIFLKTSSGVYEFSGDDFDGIVTEVESVTWGDDIEYPTELSAEYPATIKTFEVVE
jgi:hypothetical protein